MATIELSLSEIRNCIQALQNRENEIQIRINVWERGDCTDKELIKRTINALNIMKKEIEYLIYKLSLKLGE